MSTRNALTSAVVANDEIAMTLGGIDVLLNQLGFSLSSPDNAAWLKRAMAGGIPSAMMKLDGLATALRAGKELPSPPDEDDVKYVAEQRAMRTLLINRKHPMPISPTPIEFSPADSAIIESLTDLWIEGFHDGLRLQRLQHKQARHRYMS